MAKQTDTVKADFMKANKASEAARILGVSEKRFRAYLRNNLKVRVSEDPSSFNKEVKEKAYKHFTSKAEAAAE